VTHFFSNDSDSCTSRISIFSGPSRPHLGQRNNPDVSARPSNSSRRVAAPQCLHTWKCNRLGLDSFGPVGIVFHLLLPASCSAYKEGVLVRHSGPMAKTHIEPTCLALPLFLLSSFARMRRMHTTDRLGRGCEVLTTGPIYPWPRPGGRRQCYGREVPKAGNESHHYAGDNNSRSQERKKFYLKSWNLHSKTVNWTPDVIFCIGMLPYKRR
jgi:hypothetical protein